MILDNNIIILSLQFLQFFILWGTKAPTSTPTQFEVLPTLVSPHGRRDHPKGASYGMRFCIQCSIYQPHLVWSYSSSSHIPTWRGTTRQNNHDPETTHHPLGSGGCKQQRKHRTSVQYRYNRPHSFPIAVEGFSV